MQQNQTFALERSIQVLQRTPDVLRALLGGLSDFWAMNHYGPATFSPFDVVGHLIHAQRTNWMTRARIIMNGDTSAFAPIDRYAMYDASKGQSMSGLLQTCAALRGKNLEDLRALNRNEEQLKLYG